MSRGQSETRRAVRQFRNKPEFRNDGTEKFTGNHISMKLISGNPMYMGTNAGRKRKKNMLAVSFKAKKRNKRNEKN